MTDVWLNSYWYIAIIGTIWLRAKEWVLAHLKTLQSKFVYKSDIQYICIKRILY